MHNILIVDDFDEIVFINTKAIFYKLIAYLALL